MHNFYLSLVLEGSYISQGIHATKNNYVQVAFEIVLCSNNDDVAHFY